MIIYFVEQVEKSFEGLLQSLKTLQEQLHASDWNAQFLETIDNQIDDITIRLNEQRETIEDMSADIIKFDGETTEEDLYDETKDPLDEPMDPDYLNDLNDDLTWND